MNDTQPSVQLLQLVNQIYDMENKLTRLEKKGGLERNLRRMKTSLEEMGLTWENPLGEPYNETRTDCEASISGSGVDNLIITEVIKPIIRVRMEGFSKIVQRAVVIVAQKN